MSKEKKVKEKKIASSTLQKAILRLLKANPKKQFSPNMIVESLKISNNRDSVEYALGKLEEEKKLVCIAKGKYALTMIEVDKAQRNKPAVRSGAKAKINAGIFEGYVDMTRSGSAYIVCDGLEDDAYIPSNAMNNALHGDKVRVSVFHPRGKKKPEGSVIEILERATEHFIGILHLSKRYAVVMPDRQNMPIDILVELEDTKDAKDGDKVVVKIVKWQTSRAKSPVGKVTSVLGKAGTNDIEMKTILINNGFNIEFPEEVEAESEALNKQITPEEIAKRRDFRKILTLTIDPDDAKDFDDAISYEVLENGNIEVGVHIADVAHYIKLGTELDKEAFKRSTSVYLVDRCCPMLPEKLSNGLCSLRPNEDKLTFSAVFEFDKKFKIVQTWIGKTIIHSHRRYAYEEAQEILETGEGDYPIELKKLNEIAYKLRADRFKDGSINFDTEEVKFRLNEQGEPVEAYVKERKDAHLLIEDFMLLANKAVATYIQEKAKNQLEIPFVYRIHDTPNMEKITELGLFALEMGVKLDLQTPKNIAKSLNKLAKETENNPALKILEPLAIRSMAKAVYSTDNIGHYGLAFDNYSHFTSPIRRYSDVLTHRILEKNLNENTYREEKESLETKCKHVSNQERKAADAERESIKYKQVEYMKKHIGETFKGIISGMIDRGFFVELVANKCEGMVGFETLSESFQVEQNRLSFKGKRSGKTYKMGDIVTVKVINTDMTKRQIEFDLMD